MILKMKTNSKLKMNFKMKIILKTKMETNSKLKMNFKSKMKMKINRKRNFTTATQ